MTLISWNLYQLIINKSVRANDQLHSNNNKAEKAPVSANEGGKKRGMKQCL